MGRQTIFNLGGDLCGGPINPALLLTAIATVRSPIFIVDTEDRVVWSNGAFNELCGSPANIVAELKGARFPRRDSAATVADNIHNSRSDCKLDQIRLAGRRADGSVFIAEAAVTPLLNSQGAVSHFVTVMHDITQSATALERERTRLTRDELTGLSCRSHILGLLRSALGEHSPAHEILAVLFIDLDGFKKINDSYGHHIGDRLLQAVAARLVSVVRCSDTVSRYGGDEFLILLPAVSAREAAQQIGNHVIQQLAQPFAIENVIHHISASVGIAFHPGHGTTVELLLTRADEAMYAAKGQGGNRIAVATSRGGDMREVGIKTDDPWNSCDVGTNTRYSRPPVSEDRSD